MHKELVIGGKGKASNGWQKRTRLNVRNARGNYWFKRRGEIKLTNAHLLRRERVSHGDALVNDGDARIL